MKRATSEQAVNVRVPWYGRLSVRLAGLLVLTLLAFDLLGGHIYAAVFRAFGLPDDERGFTVVSSPHSTDAQGPDEGALVALLLEGAERLPNGLWQPTPEAITRTEEELAEMAGSFLWLDPQLAIVATPAESTASIGTAWQPQPEEPYEPDAPIDPSASCEHMVPAFRDGQLAGWLVFTHPLLSASDLEGLDQLDPGFDAHELPVITEEDFDAVTHSMERLARVVSFGLNLGVALIVSVLLSRLVTARLSRLSRAVASADPRGSTAVFAVRGRDEIAVLGRSLEQARGRIADLVRTLEERDRERREWVAQVSHDLRTPLTALLACIDRANAGLAVPTAELDATALRATLSSARQDVQRVCELAEDLLDVARIEAGTALVREPVLPGELVERVVSGLVPLAESRGLRIEVDLPTHAPPLDADGRRLTRVLENLLRNALRHATSKVEVALEVQDGRVRFAVADDGPGFSATGGGPQRDPDSAGLGLTVARRIVELHDGHLETLDPPAGGAIARFDLPGCAGPPDCASPEA